MNTNPEQDPWDRIVDHDRDPVTPEQMDEQLRTNHEPPAFSTGEICFWSVVAVGVIGGIILLAAKVLNVWLKLP